MGSIGFAGQKGSIVLQILQNPVVKWQILSLAISIARSEKNEHESTKTAKFSLGKIHHSLGKSSKIQSLSRKKSFLAFWAKKDFFGKKSSRSAEKSISTSEKV